MPTGEQRKTLARVGYEPTKNLRLTFFKFPSTARAYADLDSISLTKQLLGFLSFHSCEVHAESFRQSEGHESSKRRVVGLCQVQQKFRLLRVCKPSFPNSVGTKFAY